MILQQTFQRQVVHLEIEACKITIFLCGYFAATVKPAIEGCYERVTWKWLSKKWIPHCKKYEQKLWMGVSAVEKSFYKTSNNAE